MFSKLTRDIALALAILAPLTQATDDVSTPADANDKRDLLPCVVAEVPETAVNGGLWGIPVAKSINGERFGPFAEAGTVLAATNITEQPGNSASKNVRIQFSAVNVSYGYSWFLYPPIKKSEKDKYKPVIVRINGNTTCPPTDIPGWGGDSMPVNVWLYYWGKNN